MYFLFSSQSMQKVIIYVSLYLLYGAVTLDISQHIL